MPNIGDLLNKLKSHAEEQGTNFNATSEEAKTDILEFASIILNSEYKKFNVGDIVKLAVPKKLWAFSRPESEQYCIVRQIGKDLDKLVRDNILSLGFHFGRSWTAATPMMIVTSHRGDGALEEYCLPAEYFKKVNLK